jgi:hypothetical protein
MTAHSQSAARSIAMHDENRGNLTNAYVRLMNAAVCVNCDKPLILIMRP